MLFVVMMASKMKNIIAFGYCQGMAANVSQALPDSIFSEAVFLTMVKFRYNMTISIGGIFMSSLAETIRPSADLRGRYSEISRQCREDRKAVIITVNGRGDTVSLGYEQYQQMKAQIELLELLGEAEEDVRNGRVAPMQESFDSLRAELLSRE